MRARANPHDPLTPSSGRRSLRACAAAAALASLLLAARAGNPRPPTAAERLAALEARSGGRLGVAALDTGTGRRIERRADERFAMCSTFKTLLVAAVLTRVDEGFEALERRVPYTAADLLDYAPVTKEHLAEGSMTIRALCAATIEVSDNTAANLLLRELGGPEALTRFLRSRGDRTTRLDRNEPSLNSNIHGDPRDTTTPSAMLGSARKLLVGDALTPSSRKQLEDWLLACSTGAARLRAGVPTDWRMGHKTGTGAYGATNDVAILWPPGRAPIFVAVYYSESERPDAEREAVLAEVGRIVCGEFAGAD